MQDLQAADDAGCTGLLLVIPTRTYDVMEMLSVSLSSADLDSPDLHVSLQVQMPHRVQDSGETLYIFCCTQEACAARTDSWRAYRHAAPQSHSPPRKHQAADQPAQAQSLSRASVGRTMHSGHEPECEGSLLAQTDDWGLGSSDWGAETSQSQDADVSEINAALDQLSMQPTKPIQVLLDPLHKAPSLTRKAWS